MTSVFRPDLYAGSVAVITGGGSGIGFGIASLLHSLGATVVIASRNAERLEAAAAKLREAGGTGSVHIAPLDVRDQEGVKGTMARIAEAHGRIDLLVNNAAGNFYVPSEQMSPNAWRAVLDIDLSGTFFCTQAVFPYMQRAGGGNVINISMTLHYRGWPMMAHATAAKAGIDALTRTLAVEWARHNIRVNAIAPGPIPTEGVRKAFTPPGGSGAADVFAVQRAMGDYAKQTIPLGRWGDPADIANAVAFLASNAGSWITGAILVVDGGEWLWKPQMSGAGA
ncbi:MAG: SDR family oxidoreductase [Gemmatimonadaceae bacterium]